MSKQDAIKELVKAGKIRDVIGTIQAHTTSADAAYAQVRTERGYTPEHQRKLLAQSFLSADERLTAELESMARTIVTIDRDDAGQVFGIEGLPGDRASLIISRRDAGDRVAEITDRAELRSLLRRATRTGDEVLARAVAERATEIEDDTTMNAFLADRPKLERAGERLWNTERAEAGGGTPFEVSLALTGLRPSELNRATVDQMKVLAEGDETPPSEARRVFDGNSAVDGGQRMASAHGFVSNAAGDASRDCRGDGARRRGRPRST